jgi:hypothetical protein
MGIEAMKGERPRTALPLLVWVINYGICFWDGVALEFGSGSWLTFLPPLPRLRWFQEAIGYATFHMCFFWLLGQAAVGMVRADDARLNTDDDVQTARTESRQRYENG